MAGQVDPAAAHADEVEEDFAGYVAPRGMPRRHSLSRRFFSVGGVVRPLSQKRPLELQVAWKTNGKYLVRPITAQLIVYVPPLRRDIQARGEREETMLYANAVHELTVLRKKWLTQQSPRRSM